MDASKRKRKPKSDDWMEVYITHQLQDAHIVAGRLNTSHIETIVQGQPGASSFGFTLGNWGEIKVLVSPEDYERALEMLFPEEIYADDWDDELDE